MFDWILPRNTQRDLVKKLFESSERAESSATKKETFVREGVTDRTCTQSR